MPRKPKLPEPLVEMTNADLDARAARAMGCRAVGGTAYGRALMDTGSGLRVVGPADENTSNWDYWSPTTDENHFAEMREEIRRRGWDAQLSFARRLDLATNSGDFPEVDCLFAKLETRVRAACETLEAKP